MLVRHMVITAALLGGFAVAGTALMAWTYSNTKDLIAESERKDLLRKLNEVMPQSTLDIDLQKDAIDLESKPLLGSSKPLTAYLARQDGAPAAAILTCIAPDGYSGEIKLLVAIDYRTEAILGVRVLAHRETPGLGDYIEIEKSKWINGFEGHSLIQPDELGWHVQKDGGVFDQMSGATITPRAVVKAVHNALRYYQQNKARLFDSRESPS